MDEKTKKTKNPHSGHRQRMKEKVIKNGLKSLAEHEVLEVLLYFGIPQKNTNDIAHELISVFGSFSAATEAPMEELLKIKGMTANAAFLLKTLPEFSAFYQDNRLDKGKIIVSSNDEAYKVLKPYYIGKTVESPVVILLDASCKLLACEQLSDGIANAAEISVRKIVELCIKHNATQVILSHNHPSGKDMPSLDDFATTKSLSTVLKAMNVRLIDHLIITDNSYKSMASMNQFKNAFR